MTKTISSLIGNMIKGVTKGYRYKMRLVASHFPIKVEIPKDQKSIIIRNFLGGKKDKTVICKPGVQIKVDEEVKDMLVLDGIDNQNVSLTAALISQIVGCEIKRKDDRKFLDGIYVQERCLAADDDAAKNQ